MPDTRVLVRILCACNMEIPIATTYHIVDFLPLYIPGQLIPDALFVAADSTRTTTHFQANRIVSAHSNIHECTQYLRAIHALHTAASRTGGMIRDVPLFQWTSGLAPDHTMETTSFQDELTMAFVTTALAYANSKPLNPTHLYIAASILRVLPERMPRPTPRAVTVIPEICDSVHRALYWLFCVVLQLLAVSPDAAPETAIPVLNACGLYLQGTILPALHNANVDADFVERIDNISALVRSAMKIACGAWAQQLRDPHETTRWCTKLTIPAAAHYYGIPCIDPRRLATRMAELREYVRMASDTGSADATIEALWREPVMDINIVSVQEAYGIVAELLLLTPVDSTKGDDRDLPKHPNDAPTTQTQ